MPDFWKKLKKPFFALAPMNDVTDTVLRQIVVKAGKPDVFFTEFANVDGYFSAGQDAVLKKLKFSPIEKPIVAQIWGLKPENYFKIGAILKQMGFDGIDINLGCPEKKVIKNGACAALMNNRDLAAEIIKATQDGACGLPVSVKTRIGFNKIITEDWIGWLLSFALDCLTVHVRTAKEMSKVRAHWEEFGKITRLRDKISPATIIIGNGDITTREIGIELCQKYKLDGAMIGTGIFQNLFAFARRPPEALAKGGLKSIMLGYLLEHAELYEKTWGKQKNFAALKKMFKVYAAGFPGASELRAELMRCGNYKQTEEIIKDYVETH